jgi:hypothetical protein
MKNTLSRILRASSLVSAVTLLVSGCIGQKAGSGAESASGPSAAAASSCDGELVPAAEGSIDDFEDGNGQMAALGGRDGYWYIAKDPQGSAVDEPAQGTDPVDGGAGGSSKAFHVKGHTASGPEAWGVEIGTQFITDKSVQYDASKFAGISFKAKKAGDTSKVRVNVGDINTHPNGGVCKNCWNHFRKDFSLSDDWKDFTMTWNEMKQRDGWGDPRPKSITPDKVVTISFALEGGKNFEVWLDDITFLECKK